MEVAQVAAQGWYANRNFAIMQISTFVTKHIQQEISNTQ
jgi:hypothetical protein